jgi:hypothetical protein
VSGIESHKSEFDFSKNRFLNWVKNLLSSSYTKAQVKPRSNCGNHAWQRSSTHLGKHDTSVRWERASRVFLTYVRKSYSISQYYEGVLTPADASFSLDFEKLSGQLLDLIVMSY